jgi:hypothetical protein
LAWENSIRISELESALSRCPQAIAAAVLGLDTRTVRGRIRSGNYPDEGKGRTNLFQAAEFERSLKRAGAGRSESNRLKAAQADRVEQENRRRAGELIERDEIVEVFSQALWTLRAGALQLPGRAAPIISPDAPLEAEQILKAEVYDFLNDAAAKLGRLGPGSTA